MNKRNRYVALFLSFILAAIFLLPFCDLIYDCGCRVPWRGGDDLCNVHIADVPHCPWCEQRNPALMAWPFLAMFGGQAGAIFWFQRRSNNLLLLLGVGLSVFFIVGVLHGYIYGRLDSYPFFFD